MPSLLTLTLINLERAWRCNLVDYRDDAYLGAKSQEVPMNMTSECTPVPDFIMIASWT
jgi:hypothetical protein